MSISSIMCVICITTDRAPPINNIDYLLRTPGYILEDDLSLDAKAVLCFLLSDHLVHEAT